MNNPSIIVYTALHVFLFLIVLGGVLYAFRLIFGGEAKGNFGSIIGGILKETFRITRSIFLLLFTMVRSILHGIGSVILWLAGSKKKKDDLYRSRFLDRGETSQVLRRRNRGITITGTKAISVQDSFVHTAIYAPSGMGKSSTVLIPTLLRMKKCSAVVTDPSGELAQKCSHSLRKRGFRVLHLNTTDPNHSIRFNPLESVENEGDIMEIAETLVKTAYAKSGGDSAFWNNSASTLIALMLAMLWPERGRGYFNLANGRYLLNEFGEDGFELDELAVRNLSPKMFNEWKGLRTKDTKVLASFAATAITALKIFSHEAIAAISSDHTIDVGEFRTKPTVLFLQCPEHKLWVYAPYLALIYGDIIAHAAMISRPQNVKKKDWLPIHFLLDEFGNTFINGFSTLCTVLRKRECSLTILLQDPAQLNIYGAENAKVIEANMFNKLYMSGLSLETCRTVEALMGRTMKTQTEEDKEREVARSLMTADEIRTLNKRTAIFLQNNTLPAKVRLKPYFKNFWLRRKVKPEQVPDYGHADKPIAFLPIPKPSEGDQEFPDPMMN